MKFYCSCGNIISDTTDFLSYKAHLLADQDLVDYYDEIEKEIKNEAITKDDCVSNIVITHGVNYLGRALYQCWKCGRLFIEDETGQNFYMFVPEEKQSNRVLVSKEGENWKGFLHAEWRDEKPQYAESNGYIEINVNKSSRDFRNYNNKEEFEKEYYKLFAQLKTEEIIRSAWMKINNQWMHDWNLSMENA